MSQYNGSVSVRFRLFGNDLNRITNVEFRVFMVTMPINCDEGRSFWHTASQAMVGQTRAFDRVSDKR